jgi:hypothetical protein
MRYGYQRRGGGAMFFLYLLLALYCINVPIQFIKIPEFILSVEKWVILVAGIFVLLGGINFLKVRRYGI